MATVTGTFGDEKVVLNNAATEATLELLLKSIKNIPGASPADKKKLQKNTEELAESTGNASDDLDDLATAADEAEGSLSSIGSGFSKVGGAIGGFAVGMFNATSKITDLAAGFMTGSDRLSDLTEGIPIIGQITSALDANLDVYRQVSSVGATFGNSMADMRIAAARSEMSLTGFQDMISNNAESMAVLGGTVSDGAARFGRLSQELRTSDVGQQFMGMGMTMSDLNEGMADFISLQARQGRIGQMTDRELREGTQGYIEELDKLARITGKSRKEQADLIAQNQAQANVAAMRSKLEGERLQNFDASMAAASGISSEFGTVMADLGDGVAQTEFAQKLQSQVPEFGTLAEQMAAGEVSSEEFAQRIQQLAPQLEGFRDELGGAATSALMGQAGFDSLLAGITDISNFAAKAANPGEVEEEQKRRNTITEELGGFSQTITSIRSRITEAFLTSGVFESITDTLGGFLDHLSENEGSIDGIMKGILDAMQPVVDWFSNLISDIQEFGFKDTLVKLFGDITDVIKTTLFGGLTGNQQQEQSALESERTALQQSGPMQGSAAQGKEKRLAEINARLDELKQKGEGGGILSGILGDFVLPSAFKAGGALVAGGAVIAGISLLAAKFALFSPPSPAAAGVAVITGMLVGTGAAILAAGKGIDLAGDGIQKVSAGLQTMSELKDVSKLQDIGTALGGLGDGLLKLAKGGILESISSFFGADSPFEKIVDGVNEFGDIDEGALTALFMTSSNLSSLQKVTDSLDTNPLDQFTDSMVKLVGSGALVRLRDLTGDNSPLPEFANDLNSLASVNVESVNSVASAVNNLQGLQVAGENLDSSSINEYTQAVRTLTEELKNLNTELAGGEQGFFDKLNPFSKEDSKSAGQAMADSQNSGNLQQDSVNTTLNNILAVLMASNDMNKKQLGAARAMSGNLYQGF
jgi:hypothetical protein